MGAPWCDTVALVTPSKEVLAFFQKMSSKLPDTSAQFEKVLNNAVDRIGEFFNNNNSLTCFVYLGHGVKDGDQAHLDHYNKSRREALRRAVRHARGDPLKQALRGRRYQVTLMNYLHEDTKILYTTLEVVATSKQQQQPSVTMEEEEQDGIEELRGD